MRNETTTEKVTDLLQNLFINDNFATLLTVESQQLLYNHTQNFDLLDTRIQVKYTLKQLELLMYTDLIIETVLEDLKPNYNYGDLMSSIPPYTGPHTQQEKLQILNKLIEARKVFYTNHFEVINSLFYGVSIIDDTYLNNSLPLVSKIIQDFDKLYNPNNGIIENVYLPCGEMEYLNLVPFFKTLNLPDIESSISKVCFTKQDLIEAIINHISFEYFNSFIEGYFYKDSYEFFVNDFKELAENILLDNINGTYFMTIELGEIEDKERVLDFISSFYNTQLKMYNFKITLKHANSNDNKRIAVQTIVLK